MAAAASLAPTAPQQVIDKWPRRPGQRNGENLRLHRRLQVGGGMARPRARRTRTLSTKIAARIPHVAMEQPHVQTAADRVHLSPNPLRWRRARGASPSCSTQARERRNVSPATAWQRRLASVPPAGFHIRLDDCRQGDRCQWGSPPRCSSASRPATRMRSASLRPCRLRTWTLIPT